MAWGRCQARRWCEVEGRAGLDTISQLAGSMEIAAGRGASHHQKARILREGVGSLRFQVEQEQRKVVTEDQAAQRAEGSAGQD